MLFFCCWVNALFRGGRRGADVGGAVAALEVDGEGVETMGDEVAVVVVDAVDIVDGARTSEDGIVGDADPSRAEM